GEQDLFAGTERVAAGSGDLFYLRGDVLVSGNALKGSERLGNLAGDVFFHSDLHSRAHRNLQAIAPCSVNCTVMGCTCSERSTRNTSGRRIGSTTNIMKPPPPAPETLPA